MDWTVIPSYGNMLLLGLVTTIKLLLVSGIAGFAFAVVVAFARISRNPLIANASKGFTALIRGTPLLVQIYILYYGVGSLFAQWPWLRTSVFWPFLRDGFWYVAFALVVSVGAYVGEVIRAGLRGVPKGELEAARAMGMRPLLIVRRVWLPRAIQILLPTLAGESVMLLKSTALASTVAVMDVLGAANYIRAQTLRTYEPLLAIAVIYVVLAYLIERGFGYLERRVPVRSAR
ncbi:ABC transporter permease [Paraburkholderia pallida]|uniref:ABC transporter permease subunit n=1 Tax=Paraburkholderia pallida TaxID=2547399 RepID=A0A4P7D5L2_9BURK|nr:ABC transporter permease subunit [Paraburkholderia pallida]QBR02085.1 ABC transporter permease subunit [Paraburkholderia pallida]